MKSDWEKIRNMNRDWMDKLLSFGKQRGGGASDGTPSAELALGRQLPKTELSIQELAMKEIG